MIEQLMSWYAAQCNGVWEHSCGIAIETLDNPGWSVTIDLAGTTLAGRPFEPVRDIEPELEWIDCHVKDQVFIGHGGPEMLAPIISAFLAWAGAGGVRASTEESPSHQGRQQD